MGIVTDKLNEIYDTDQRAEKIFALQELTKRIYQGLQTAISNGSLIFPTGDEEFDTFYRTIVNAMISLRTTLDSSTNQEFINWTAPEL